MLHFTVVLILLICAVEADDRSPFENMNVPESEHLQHGDMIPNPNPSRAGHKLNKWPGGIFLYEFHSSIANEPQAVKVIKDVMAYYEKITCVKFRKRTNERCFVQFTRRDDKAGCSSNVGRICWPGGQHLNLAKGCWSKGVVIHEIAHALGFLHEQDRPDRDQYVRIIKENLQDGWKNVLDQPKDVQTNYDTSGTPYDYLSIMHYTQTAFAKRDRNGKLLTTIEIKDKSFKGTTGNKHDFSRWDVEEINRFYKCPGHTNPPTTKPPTCVDKNNNCRYWKSYCSWHGYVKQNCKKTCNLC